MSKAKRPSKRKESAVRGPAGPFRGRIAAVRGLAVAGAVLSTWLVWIHFSLLSRPDAGTACNLGGYFNCDAVNASGFATQLDVPVAYIGLLFYLFLGVLGTAGLLCGSRPRTLAYSRGLGAVSVLTPTFIIGKRMVTGARSRADLAALIREELAAARGVGS